MSSKNSPDGKQIHWYPGHMASAARQLRENWRHIDAVIEVADARIPRASRNPLFLDFRPAKPHLLLLSHADLADDKAGSLWLDYFKDQPLTPLFCDLHKPGAIRQIRRELLVFHTPLLEKARKQGRLVRPLRILVAGIPNTGKSTLINQFVGKRSARVKARPGVTRQLNWLRSGTELHFLDSPGILPAKLDDRQAALALAATGAIRDSILPMESLARWLFLELTRSYTGLMGARYGAEATFEEAAVRMGCLLTEGEIDVLRFSQVLLDDFRSGRIGAITLERPFDEGEVQNG